MEFNGKLVVAVSSRALFNLDESHQIFETEGKEAYCAYQIEHEEDILEPGFGYELVRKLLAINALATKSNKPLVEVILLSQNSADTGLRIFNSIDHYKLDITRAAFTSGMTPFGYIPAFGAHLFLSANADDVAKALAAKYAAATILSGTKNKSSSEQLRIAFDGDAVLFSDHSERIYQEQGLAAFTENEKNAAKIPLPGGPFKGFLEALQAIQAQFAEHDSPIRTALVTARSAPAHERVVRTLRKWGIRIDEALFLGGMPKREFLKAFGADIFFDDQKGHCEDASRHISTAHVPHGVINEVKTDID
ncbi:MAG: 5'-nucleotidase [Gammaproteobacteria bacterium]|nr:MAG: 5'-nucleotidase [Gammaproteobacteria bacterium]